MIGNVMNQGTGRGEASGFTVESLLKMINTKGSVLRPSWLIIYLIDSIGGSVA